MYSQIEELFLIAGLVGSHIKCYGLCKNVHGICYLGITTIFVKNYLYTYNTLAIMKYLECEKIQFITKLKFYF